MTRRSIIPALICAACVTLMLRQLYAQAADTNDPLESVSPIVRVANLEEAMKYYIDVLGFREDFKLLGEPPVYGAVSRGKVRLHLVTTSNKDERGRVYVKDKTLDKLHEEFKKKSAEIESPPRYQPIYRMREMLLKTPDGNEMVFAEPGEE